MFSAYQVDPSFGWTAVHRLPLDDAIKFCKYQRAEDHRPVAVVPDGENPEPYLRIALGQPHYGFANPEGYLPTTFA